MTDLAKPLPTPARLSLGRTAPSIATSDHLQFQLDHALARDAVHTQLDTATLIHGLKVRSLEPILLRSAIDIVASQTQNRRTYLRRPDLGRKLHHDSIATLQSHNPIQNAVILSEASRNASPREAQSKDPEAVNPTQTAQNLSANEPPTLRVAIILADGLSAHALERHALPLLDALQTILKPGTLNLEPVSIATNARVAIADEIGHHLHAELTILLIGERPGLSSPDSLGCYITWNPRPGRTDAERNCISNIRGDEGLGYAVAAHRIAHYLAEAGRLQTTGTALKDPTTTLALPNP